MQHLRLMIITLREKATKNKKKNQKKKKSKRKSFLVASENELRKEKSKMLSEKTNFGLKKK